MRLYNLLTSHVFLDEYVFSVKCLIYLCGCMWGLLGTSVPLYSAVLCALCGNIFKALHVLCYIKHSYLYIEEEKSNARTKKSGQFYIVSFPAEAR